MKTLHKDPQKYRSPTLTETHKSTEKEKKTKQNTTTAVTGSIKYFELSNYLIQTFLDLNFVNLCSNLRKYI